MIIFKLEMTLRLAFSEGVAVGEGQRAAEDGAAEFRDGKTEPAEAGAPAQPRLPGL